MKSEIDLILTSELSKYDTVLEPKQKVAVMFAMLRYSEHSVDQYRRKETKAINLEAVKLFPALLKGDYKMWLRKRAYKKAVKMAQKRADTENRKIYCIRTTDIAYTTLSTSEVKAAKKAGVFDKKVNALMLHETADFIAYPKTVVHG